MREDIKGKWFANYIDKLDDEAVEASKVTHICPKCKKEKLMKYFVTPTWWDGYQTWKEECEACIMEHNMKEIAKVMVELPKRFPQVDAITTHIVSPKGTIKINLERQSETKK